MPSFDWRIHRVKAFLASGMVIDLEKLYNEIIANKEQCLKQYAHGFSLLGKIYVDPDAFIVSQKHKDIDAEKNGSLGTTNRGIGPAYADKVSRTGTRIKDLLKDNSEITTALKEIGVQFKHVLELENEFSNSNLLFEGAQGTMIDLNHGTYPYVSCGDATIAGIYSSGFAGIAKLDNVYGVAKCYTTKVGTGPFPTEIFNDEAEELRKLGNEYGATTGRPRRVGWIDLPALEYAVKKSGVTDLVITKFDILNGMKNIKMCVAYDKKPVCPDDFFEAKPQYISIPGWKDAANTDQLKEFIKFTSAVAGKPVSLVSFGKEDCDMRRL